MTNKAQNSRTASNAYLVARGISVPGHLPLIETDLTRSEAEVVDRLLCLNVCAAAAYGYDRQQGMSWVAKEGLEGSLETIELAYLKDGSGPTSTFQKQVEAIYALAWALSLQNDLDLQLSCRDDFVLSLPNLKSGEASAKLRAHARLRPTSELLRVTDLAYSVHWHIRNEGLAGREDKRFRPHVVVERRRALEWLFSNKPWYEVNLDT